MSTVESLFVQIFERKKRIIEQVKQQAELYNQHLASKLLIEGITPPWLLNPSSRSISSDPEELKKEELISKLLLPHPKPSVPCSHGYSHMCEWPVFTGDKEEVSGLFLEVHASNKDHDAGDKSIARPEFHDHDVPCALNYNSEMDVSINSPKDHRDKVISDGYIAPDKSLARIQRSKSRQKALELRNSNKAAPKSRLGHENNIFDALNGSSTSRGQFSQKFPETNDINNQQRNAEPVAASEFVQNMALDAPVSSGSNLECIVSRPQSDCCVFIDPKQLDFDDMEQYNLSKSFSPSLENERKEKSIEKICTGLSKSAKSVVKVTFDNCCERSLDKTQDEGDVKSQLEEAQQHSFEANFECIEGTAGKFGFDISNDPMPVNINGNSKAVFGIQDTNVSGTDVAVSNFTLSPDRDIPRAKFHLTEWCKFSQSPQIEEGEHGYEGRQESASPCDEWLGSSLVSSLTKHTTIDSQYCLVMEAGELEAKSIPDARRQCSLLSNQVSVRAEDYYGNDGEFTYIEKAEPELKSPLRQYELVKNISAGSRHTEDENPTLSKLREIQLVEKSSLPERTLSSGLVSTWPQLKRRRIEGQPQPACCFSSTLHRVQQTSSSRGNSFNSYLKGVEYVLDTSPKFQYSPVCLKDRIESTAIKSPVVQSYENMECYSNGPDVQSYENMEFYSNGAETSFKQQTEVGNLGSEERNMSMATPSLCKDEHFESLISSTPAEQAELSGKGCTVEEVRTEDPTRNVLDDVTDEINKNEYEPSSNLENNVETMETVDPICENKFHHEIKSPLSQDLPPHFLAGSPYNDLDLASTGLTLPVFEGFTVDAETEFEKPNITADGINFDDVNLPSTLMERASVLEQICKSARMHTPLSNFSSTFKLHENQNLHQSVPNGLLERIELRSALPLDYDVGKQLSASYCHADEIASVSGMPYSDCLPYSYPRFNWKATKPYTSPVGKLWARMPFHSGSSGKKLSSNPELTCFPIEEDPSSGEEDEDGDEVVGRNETIGSIRANTSAKRKAFVDITEACSKAAPTFSDRSSVDSIKTEVSFTGTHKRVQKRCISNKKRVTNAAKENRMLSVGANGFKRTTESIHNRISKPKLSSKTSLRKGTQKLFEESKHNNIVSNITSFIPLVQQKQADAVCTGKRDIKVKALEAAEAAKRIAEKRENERKLKKEALKLERARLEQENLKKVELKKKTKEEEQKKKDAEIATRRRLREEEERKEKERKRKRHEESRQNREEEKLRAGKVKKEKRMDEKVKKLRESNNESWKHQKMENQMEDDKLENPGTDEMSISETQAVNHELETAISREQSYEISPYRASDSEDEAEEDEKLTSDKFIPSWASKHSVAQLLLSQQNIDHKVIFPRESFCSLNEVLLPRNLRPK